MRTVALRAPSRLPSAPGAPPRDIMRRRVRVAEYYRIPPQGANTKWEVQLYDESRDTW